MMDKEAMNACEKIILKYIGKSNMYVYSTKRLPNSDITYEVDQSGRMRYYDIYKNDQPIATWSTDPDGYYIVVQHNFFKDILHLLGINEEEEVEFLKETEFLKKVQDVFMELINKYFLKPNVFQLMNYKNCDLMVNVFVRQPRTDSIKINLY